MSSDSDFRPRKEFSRPDAVRHDFGLLAISGNSSIRLYSFPHSLVSRLRQLLGDRIGVSAFREDTVQNFCEITLDGKPWGSPKAVLTESLLVAVLRVIYQCNYTFLSLLDYGRERDDRLAMAFSTPTTSTMPPLNPLLPFALSFPSPTELRVIAPPLHSTPAILQAVRGAWPRGVVSEKKVSEDTYEFKLKGYRWFQEDTFATDSLRHILTLLSSLDTHSFTLLSSVSLTNRSRVKDLWVFTGLLPDGDLRATSPSPLPFGSSPNLGHSTLPSYHTPSGSPRHFGHRKLASEPAPILPDVRAEDGVLGRSHTNMLRKHSPRPRTPVSVVVDSPVEGYEPSTRSTLAGGPNLAGIGVAGVVEGLMPPKTEAPTEAQSQPFGGPSYEPTSDDKLTPPSLAPLPVPKLNEEEPASGELTPSAINNILSPEAFRDSTLTTHTESTHDIPIEWTGPPLGSLELPHMSSDLPVAVQPETPGPQIPGAWQPTPVEEKHEPMVSPSQEQDHDPSVKDASAAHSPVLSAGKDIRKSEAGIVTNLPSSTRPEDVPSVPPVVPPPNAGTGWVMVNVAGNTESIASPVTSTPNSNQSVDPARNDAQTPSPSAETNKLRQGSDYKDVLVEDALKHSKTKRSKENDSKGSLASVSKTVAQEKEPSTQDEAQVQPPTKKSKFGLRQKLGLGSSHEGH